MNRFEETQWTYLPLAIASLTIFVFEVSAWRVSNTICLPEGNRINHVSLEMRHGKLHDVKQQLWQWVDNVFGSY